MPNRSADAASCRILVVDDDEQVRRLVRRLIANDFPEAEVHEAGAPTELDTLLASGPFDLTITDYDLRWGTGLEVLSRVKRNDPDCPVIMFTGTGSEEVAVSAMKAGLDDYVVKSASHLSRLSAAVRAAIERSRRRRLAAVLIERYQRLFDRVPLALFRTDADGAVVEANPALHQLLGLRPESAVGRPLGIAGPDGASWRDLVERGEPFDVWVERADGARRELRVVAAVVRDHEGRVLFYEGALEDVTAQRATARQLEELVIEREALLRELHHRVKNNFQLISSLMNLELDAGGQEPSSVFVRKTQSRLRALALVHERLYQEDTPTSIDLASYLRGLVASYGTILGVVPTHVQFDVEATAVDVGPDTAIRCGLIVNELISNSLKHAFADGQPGTVRILVHAGAEPGRAVVRVSDSGAGLPTDLDLETPPRLGLQMVVGFARQMRARLTVHRPAADFELEFPQQTPAPLR